LSLTPITVRPLATPTEYQTYFHMADQAFSYHPSREDERRWQDYILRMPGFRAEQLRDAFRADQQLGGYTMFDRVMRMGTARISTGCIGAVVTANEHRRQGVASALMHDAIDYARQRGHTLLMLDGIPRFYYRYGYTDIYDVSSLEVDHAAILAHKPHPYHIRAATPDDADAMLALYNRCYASYTGSFERSLETQTYYLREGRQKGMVAQAENGDIEGYLYLHLEEQARAREVAATDWPALHALLYYHATRFDEHDAPATLHYILSPDSLLAHWMIDHLEVPDTSQWHGATLEGAVHGRSYHHRHAAWMARIVHLPTLMAALLPELQERWRRTLASWHGELVFTIGDEAFALHIHDRTVQLVEVPGTTSAHVTLSSQQFVEVLFGYRPLSYFVHTRALEGEPGQALALLFPAGHTWIPASDWF
jgi:predicted N-acetyltransferase YhbS